MFGKWLARDFGILTGDPAVVNISLTLAEAMRPQLHSFCLEAGLAAGSEFLHSGLVGVSPYTTYLPDEIAEISRIYAFDLLVQNPDRRRLNPNCAIYGKRVFAYDFETAFSFLHLFGVQADPWKLSALGINTDHVFRDVLRGQHVNWTPFIESLSNLSETRILSLASKVPTEWQTKMPRMCEHMLLMAEHASELAVELQRSLS